MPYKKILITGGAGFVGTNVSRALIEDGHEVIILDDLSTGLKSNVENLQHCELIEGTLENPDLVDYWVSKSDYIVHLGARGSVPRSIKNPQATFRANILGTFNVVESVRKSKKPILFSSSSSVYGSNIELPNMKKCGLPPLLPMQRANFLERL